MNKLVLDNDNQTLELETISVKKGIYYFTKSDIFNIEIENRDTSLSFYVKDNLEAVVNILETNSNLQLCYHLGVNSKLIVNQFGSCQTDIIDVFLEEENANIEYHYAGLFKNKSSDITINIHHLASNTTSNIYNHLISFSAPLVLNVQGEVLKSSAGCICNQDNKIINIGPDLSLIKPNLLISNNDIEASHSAYIGKFNRDDVFFLQSRGLSLSASYNLLIIGFILGGSTLDSNYSDKIKQIIENYGGDYNES
ncbi:MAG: SufD family Fe-S cluster assembly protein [Bacilli bacterium]